MFRTAPGRSYKGGQASTHRTATQPQTEALRVEAAGTSGEQHITGDFTRYLPRRSYICADKRTRTVEFGLDFCTESERVRAVADKTQLKKAQS